MAGKTQVKNQEYIEAYNTYLADHNLVQARATFVDAGGLDYPIDIDMFYNYLVDQVAMQVITDVRFDDPLGDLYKGAVHEGRILQDISPVSGYKFEDYDVQDFEEDVTNPYKKKKDDLSVYYMTTDEYKKVKTTYSRKQVLSAFQTAYGIDALVNSIITLLYTKKSAWTYNAKKKKIASPNFVTRKNITSYIDFTLKIKDIIDELRFSYDNSYKYNRAVIPKPVAQNDILIVLKASYKNRVDVEYLAGLFNVSFAELSKSVKFKYIDEFPDMPQRIAVVCDMRGLYFYKVLNMDTVLPNQADLTQNHWVHFWEMIEACPNYNAIAYDEYTDAQLDAMPEVAFNIDGVPNSLTNISSPFTKEEFNFATPTTNSQAAFIFKFASQESATGYKYSIDNGELQDLDLTQNEQLGGFVGSAAVIGANKGLHVLKLFPPSAQIGDNKESTYVVRFVKVTTESVQ